jgi:hypothetical protein
MRRSQAVDLAQLALLGTGLHLSQSHTNILWSFQQGWFHA